MNSVFPLADSHFVAGTDRMNSPLAEDLFVLVTLRANSNQFELVRSVARQNSSAATMISIRKGYVARRKVSLRPVFASCRSCYRSRCLSRLSRHEKY